MFCPACTTNRRGFTLGDEINTAEALLSESASVIDFIIKQSSDILKSVELFDVFESSEIGGDKKSMAFSLEYFDFNRTLTDEEVDKDFQSLIKKVTTNFNAVLRGK